MTDCEITEAQVIVPEVIDKERAGVFFKKCVTREPSDGRYKAETEEIEIRVTDDTAKEAYRVFCNVYEKTYDRGKGKKVTG